MNNFKFYFHDNQTNVLYAQIVIHVFSIVNPFIKMDKSCWEYCICDIFFLYEGYFGVVEFLFKIEFEKVLLSLKS